LELGARSWGVGWRQWRDAGPTAHRNWWPAVDLAWCRAQNLTPDEKILACATTYETPRADLKTLAGSA